MRLYKPMYRSPEGKKIPTARWYCDFKDPGGARRRLPAFTDRKASEELARRLERLIALRTVGDQPDAATRQWLESIPRKLQQQRYWLYRLAVETGLRRGELASLTRASFVLEATDPVVTVQAAYSKRRRADVQPLRSDTAEDLQAFLKRKGSNDLIFPVPDHTRSAGMLRADLAAAGIPYRDEQSRVADFHSLRHCFVSNLAAAGVHPKKAQELARHSSITLTMDHYAHTDRSDLAAALDRLPDLSAHGSDQEIDEDPEDFFAFCFAKLSGFQQNVVDSGGLKTTDGQFQEMAECATNSARNAEFANACIHRGRRDSNSQPPDRQSGTLTN